jgi:hypothetical protein
MRDAHALLSARLLMDQLHLTADGIFSLFCLLSQLQPELAVVLKFCGGPPYHVTGSVIGGARDPGVLTPCDAPSACRRSSTSR